MYVYVGHLTSVAFPTLENLTKNLGPRVGTFAFFGQRNRTKSHHSMCLSVFRAAIKALKVSCFQWRYTYKCTCKHFFLYLYKNTTSHYLFSILTDGTPYFAGIVDDMDSLFVSECSIGNRLNVFIHWLGGGYLIRFDQILGSHSGILDQKFFWKVKCPTYARGPLPRA